MLIELSYHKPLNECEGREMFLPHAECPSMIRLHPDKLKLKYRGQLGIRPAFDKRNIANIKKLFVRRSSGQFLFPADIPLVVQHPLDFLQNNPSGVASCMASRPQNHGPH